MKYPEISVVVPCYQESAVIENTLSSLATYLAKHFERFEIVVVTDGSPDNTREKVQLFGQAHPKIALTLISFQKNRGKGAAVREGVLSSRYNFILFIDADLTIPIEELEKFLPSMQSSDLAIASRLAPGSIFEEKAPWYRTVLARGFHLLQILLLGNFEYSDTQCGFKLFKKDTARTLFQKIRVKRYAFDAELLFLAKKMNFSVAILPVTIKKDARNTNVNTLRDPINMFCALIKIRWNDLLSKYE